MSHVHVLRNMSVLQSVYGYSYSRDPEHIRHECTTEISLLNAADCLYYRFNRQEWVRYIWAVGLLAAGQSSTMTVSATTVHVHVHCTCIYTLHVHTCTCTSTYYYMYMYMYMYIHECWKYIYFRIHRREIKPPGSGTCTCSGALA